MKKKLAMFFAIGAMTGVWMLVFETAFTIYDSVVEDKQDESASVSSPASTASDAQVETTTYDRLVDQVIPASGTTIHVIWGDMGQKLVDAGAVDMAKMENHYGTLSQDQQEILQGDSLQEITFTSSNIQFWTNMLWAFGLTQQSKVLGEGLIKQREAEYPIGNYASTGGWTLGSKDAVELYNSTQLVELTPEQDEMIFQMAGHIFRPCCGNHTAFPDCYHGMAVLGLLELMASQGASEQEMYQAALAFNSYAFAGSYVTLAAYFDTQNIAWSDVDAATVLNAEYSSGQGAQQIAAQVGSILGAPGKGGGSCGA